MTTSLPKICLFPVVHVMLSLGLMVAGGLFPVAHGQLDPNYYAGTCPRLLNIVRNGVGAAVRKESRMAASLLRLHFHDCIVDGCEASALLDDMAGVKGEKTALPNNNSARGYGVIDAIKAQVEIACPKTVSCADILALAARDAVVLVGGLSWKVGLGRRDGVSASLQDANNQIPAPIFPLQKNFALFTSKGLDFKDLVVLSGAHTIGMAQCKVFRTRLYNFNGTGLPDPTLDLKVLKRLQAACPNDASSDTNLVALDYTSPDPNRFDNKYYSNLVGRSGVLASDQGLMGDPLAASMVRSYGANPALFLKDFADSMVKLGNLGVLTGEEGEIRTKCRSIN